MLRGEVKCKNLNCASCPFTSEPKLRHCTRFKLNDTLFEGLEKNKPYLSAKDYYKANVMLNKEITEKELVNSYIDLKSK